MWYGMLDGTRRLSGSAARRFLWAPQTLWLERLSRRVTKSPRSSSDTSTVSTQVLKGRRLIIRSRTKGKSQPLSVSGSTKVAIFPGRWACPMHVAEVRVQPWVRAMLVVAQISATRTKSFESRAVWLSCHACRRSKTYKRLYHKRGNNNLCNWRGVPGKGLRRADVNHRRQRALKIDGLLDT